jgi:cyclopropane-fatty-acyl-phospholipid synthase
MIESYLERKFLKAFEKLRYGKIEITMPNGKKYNFEGREFGPQGELIIHDYSMILNLYARGDIGFADDYRGGKWDSPDLAALIEVCLLNDDALNECIFGSGFFRALVKFSYFFKQNSMNGSKRNIHAHYDIGNDFYSLWLDKSMSYSSALYEDGNESLEQAQHKKYDRIINRIGSSSSVLEIGCGWGGFAEKAIESNHKVKGLTISTQQHDFAKQRIAPLCKESKIVLEDYRLQANKFDNIVSIEMFEAVGEKYWKTYFDKIKSLMAKGGRSVIQTITIDEKYFDSYRKGGDAIRSYIFPGGMLPSKTAFKQTALNSGLKTTDLYEFGQDYSATLREWLKNFDAKKEEVKALGMDEKFIRIWRYYLASCAGAFAAKRTNVMQVELMHA